MRVWYIMSVLKAKFYPDSVNHTQITWMVSSCSYNMIIASGHLRLFVENFSNFDSVQTVSILSGRFKYCPDGFNTVRTVSILSGRFQYCPDGFNTVRRVSILSGMVSILSGRYQYCPEGFNTVRTANSRICITFCISDAQFISR